MNRMERRSLTNGMHAIPNADPVAVRQFVKQEQLPPDSADGIAPLTPEFCESSPRVKANEDETYSQSRRKGTTLAPVALIPVTVRLHPEIAVGLKRASLERQLAGEEVYTQQELVEQALGRWLKSQGYIA